MMDVSQDAGNTTGREVPLLEITNAVVRRDDHVILAIDHLAVGRGERVCVLGPNGAGKSTLIKLLTHEVYPLWREVPPVLFCGDPRPEVAQMRRILGVVSATMQDQIDVHLTAEEVVLGGFFGSLGVPRAYTVNPEQRDIAAQRLVDFGAAHLAQRDITTLSTGQARRVLFARAMVADPQIVVFDEPCNGLDPEGAWHVRQLLSTLADSGKSVMLVTHLVEDIRPEFDRVLLLQDGRIVVDGPKGDTLTTERMRDLFHVPVTLEERKGQYHLW